MTAPSRATIAGQAYLDLRRKARQDRRPVNELIQLYVLEGFLARLAQTPFAEQFVLKGGMLLAALGERRPTRDIDLQASATGADTGTVLDTDVDSPVHHGGEESTKAWAPGATSGPAGRRRGVLGGA